MLPPGSCPNGLWGGVKEAAGAPCTASDTHVTSGHTSLGQCLLSRVPLHSLHSVCLNVPHKAPSGCGLPRGKWAPWPVLLTQGGGWEAPCPVSHAHHRVPRAGPESYPTPLPPTGTKGRARLLQPRSRRQREDGLPRESDGLCPPGPGAARAGPLGLSGSCLSKEIARLQGLPRPPWLPNPHCRLMPSWFPHTPPNSSRGPVGCHPALAQRMPATETAPPQVPGGVYCRPG